MKLLEGKRGLIVGVANNRSIAWGIAEACRSHGAELAFTYAGEALEKRVVPLAETVSSSIVLPCDVTSDTEIDSLKVSLSRYWDSIDFVVHSVAYAPGDDLKQAVHQTSREGFSMAMDVSVYSLIALIQRLRPMLTKGSSITTLSYLGAVQVVPNYRVMGIAKAALEACVRELAADLGPEGIRVNAISAGPIKTLAASGISRFKELLQAFEARAPLRRLVDQEDVGLSAVYLASELSRGVTGEVHYVDCGFNVCAL